jgi:hypothetical protein
VFKREINDDKFLKRANRNLNLKEFEQFCNPVFIGCESYNIPEERQYILRMMVRSPESVTFRIPKELDWLAPTIFKLNRIQVNSGLDNQFVYVTVRHGIVNSETDDIWHVDGFSMKIPHKPEQNYIWTNHSPTEFAAQPMLIPGDFDPMKHHLHWYLNENVRQENVRSLTHKAVFLFDPYFIHRRPKSVFGVSRTFWRISFVPIEIEDGECTQNPLMPVKTYANDDIRRRLVKYSPSQTH